MAVQMKIKQQNFNAFEIKFDMKLLFYFYCMTMKLFMHCIAEVQLARKSTSLKSENNLLSVYEKPY